MSAPLHEAHRGLDACGCCEGTARRTPARVHNRPGLSAIGYRIGAHASFRGTMLAALARADLPALAGLTTRDDADFTPAFLDATAAVLDVLSFYRERVANESYLATARERRSVVELARLLGYRPGPGVAADAWLAFTIEANAGTGGQLFGTSEIAAAGRADPAPVIIPEGTAVGSVPGPGEDPQTFETVEAIEGRAAWNALHPRRTRPPVVTVATQRLRFQGAETGIKAGDGVLFEAADGAPVFAVVEGVEVPRGEDVTLVAVRPAPSPATHAGGALALVETPPLSDLAARYSGRVVAAGDLAADAETDGFDPADLFENLREGALVRSAVVFHTRAAVFGHNAPALKSLPSVLRGDEPVYDTKSDGTIYIKETIPGPFKGRETTWASADLEAYHDAFDTIHGSAPRAHVHLDAAYPKMAEGDLVVLRDGGVWGVYGLTGAEEISLSDFTLTAKVTGLVLDAATELDVFRIRTTTVFGEGERLPLAPEPVLEAVSAEAGAPVELDGWVDGLRAGQRLLLAGELADAAGSWAAEVAEVRDVVHDLARDGATRVSFAAGLVNRYVRDTVTVNGNVAAATHGERSRGQDGSRWELLGSGDGSIAFQSFRLARSPLTHVGASTAGGSLSTLEVRVNDLLWTEVETLLEAGPRDKVYVTRETSDGETLLTFGDGRTGARLPTGQNNVRATYRHGIGAGGLVRARQLAQMMARPAGVQEVTNPLPADGAADPESLADARRNAPLAVLTLDRVVSLRDYEDFARAFAGIDKALASWSWLGQQRCLHLTVAGADGAAVPDGSPLRQRLIAALREHGEPDVPLRVTSYASRLFRLGASLVVDGAYEPEPVLAGVEAALRQAFSFDARAFGQPVHLSEVYAVIQATDGVAAATVTALHYAPAADGSPVEGPTSGVQPRLGAAAPRAGRYRAEAAGLLTLEPGPLALEVSG